MIHSDHSYDELLQSIARIHTTPLGVKRIQRNLSLSTANVIEWCQEFIQNPNACITRRGKNWYITLQDCQLTVNAYSYTIITAHKLKTSQI